MQQHLDGHTLPVQGMDFVAQPLIEEIGFAPVDTGSLREGSQLQQPGAPIYDRPLTVEQARALLSAER
jgi:8-hydroxy-5-deazaflavin:NADPH oxidoreductase